MTIKLGIIGTAFRSKDTEFDSILTKDLYLNKIYPKALEVVKELKVDTVISGGAAGIDHLAPLLYDCNEVKYLRIYYPTQFIDTTSLIAKTLIKYHFNFSNIIFNTPYNSLSLLSMLFSRLTNNIYKKYGDNSIVFNEEVISNNYSGFFSRNKKIANNSDYLLVFSYFDNGNCLTSGTDNTIKEFCKVNSEDKIIKIDIRDLV